VRDSSRDQLLSYFCSSTTVALAFPSGYTTTLITLAFRHPGVDEDTANVDYRGIMAVLAAEGGDSAQADRLDAWLAGLPPARALWTLHHLATRADYIALTKPRS
jgi:hypothetical protein